DLGIEAVHDRGRVLGFDLIAGGGMGFTHSKKETYARLGTRLARVKPDEAREVIEEIVKVQRDFGGRADRNHARLKYLLDDKGVDWFKEELFRRLGRDLPDAAPQPRYEVHDHLGWGEDSRGKLFIGIPIMNGRVQDTEKSKLQTGLREIVSRVRPDIRFTPLQNIILAGLEPSRRGEIERMLGDYGIATVEKTPTIERRAMACPALPTCGLALADSERVLPSILDEIEKLGSGNAQIELRMTGCPNSCVRTPTAEIGISGRGPGKYVMHIGGSHEGTRLAYLFRETINSEEIAPLIHKMIQSWRADAGAGESFGDWAHRRGRAGVDAILSNGQ
ncbi:NADPH-dependent assimilatory sulfite reductase hemoprotein subunit, partial [Candidatus Sumerlaeota bacterium]|nr:NADPH-dependent assimilatory sulfite reductase hemoprotein subunit [Candidatus Sumerlaeota bacterium]